MRDKSCAGITTLVLAASRRSDSLNRELGALALHAIEETGAEGALYTLADFSCPFFDGDLEKASGVPPELLQYCPPDARLIDTWARASIPTCSRSRRRTSRSVTTAG